MVAAHYATTIGTVARRWEDVWGDGGGGWDEKTMFLVVSMRSKLKQGNREMLPQPYAAALPLDFPQ
jgi:hypothetical protein